MFYPEVQGEGDVQVTFTADETGTTEEFGVVTTGVKGGDEYLMFMRGLDDSDIEDWGVYLEYGDQGNGGYGCIKACVLDRFRLDVELSKSIDRPKAIVGFHVRLTLSNEQLETLIAGLKKVFRDGSDVLKIVT
jgi:hypothetical protein